MHSHGLDWASGSATGAAEVELRELSVTADGDFDGEELSTGISFSISITGAGTEDVLRDLAQFGADDSTIAKVLQHPTSVTLTTIDARAASEPVA